MKIDLESKLKQKKTIFAFIVALIAISLLLYRIDISKVIEVYKEANIIFIIIAGVLCYSNFFLKGMRWRILLKNTNIDLGALESVKIVFLSLFANTLVPAKLGDLYRGYLLKKRRSESMSEVTGTVVAERAIDFIFILSLLTISSFFIAGAKFSEVFSYIKLGYVFVGIAIIAFIVIRSEFGSRYLPESLNQIINKFRRGAVNSISLASFPKIITLTFLIWGFGVARMYFLSVALGLGISLPVLTFLALLIVLLSAIPITPAGLGAVEILSSAFLVLVGISQAEAVSLILLSRSITWMSLVISGSIFYICQRKKVI